ncbi:tail fiber domain-containing protein, partial [Patescibacteria group bacterium]
NTESSLESFLSGVTNVFTDGDTITSSNISDTYLFNNADDSTTGSLTATEFIANDAAATSTFAGGLTVDTDKFVVDPDGGRVGIGTASPTEKLHVVGSDSSPIGMRFENTGIGNAWVAIEVAGADKNPYLDFTANDTRRWSIGSDGANNQNFYFYSHEKTGGADRVISIDKDGYLGIGTTSPTTLLTVGSSTPTALLASDYYNSLYVSGAIESGSTATSTFAGGVDLAALNITGSATSTAANGINLTAGCFSINGTCLDTSGGVWGSITGTLSNQTDLQSALDAKLSLSDWYGTTTSDIAEGTNLYYTDARVNTLINASSTIWNNNTESSLESFLSGVTNVFTNNDTIGVANGGTGATTFAQGWLHSTGGTSALTASTSPTVNYITATSTATSTFAGGVDLAALNITGSATSTAANGINIAAGCFSVNGTCLDNTSATWGSITGTLSNQTDLQSALNTKFSLSDWYSTTTSDIAEGTNLYYTADRVAGVIAGTTTTALSEGDNLYWTNDRFDTRLSATTTLPNLTTLANLVTVGTIGTGVWEGTAIADSYISSSANWNTAYGWGDHNDLYIGIATTSVDSITTLANLTTTGALNSGSITSGFGSINTGADNITTTGTGSFGNITATNAAATSTFAGGLTVDSTDFVVDPDGGRVGIGTASPGSALHLYSDAATGPLVTKFEYTGSDTGTTAYMGLTFTDAVSDTGYFLATTPNYTTTGSYVASQLSFTSMKSGGMAFIERSTGPIVFNTGGYTTDKERLRITNTGNIGIGTTSPTTLLTVGSSTPTALLASDYYNSLYVSGAFESGSTATSTFAGGVDLLALNITGSATSTAANGINLTAGCFSVNGTCVGGAASLWTDNGSYLTTAGGEFVDVLYYVATSTTNKSTFAGGVDTSGTTGGYSIDDNLILQASSTNYSTLVGQSAGESLLVDGFDNTAIGYRAGRNTTNGDDNSFLGYSAGNSNTTGSYNSFSGSYSGYANTIGDYNSFFGYTTGYANVTGSGNSFFGSYAGRYNNSATSSVAIGYQAARGTTAYNAGELTVVGTDALYNITTGAEDNTALGYRAGYANTSGANNIFLGYQSGDNLTTGSNNIVLGYDIDAPAVDSANTLNIGNLIFGTSIDGTGTTLSSGNIGIGTSSPYAKLSVNGFINTDGTTGGYKIDNNTVLQASSTNFSTMLGIGAGTSTPYYNSYNTFVGYWAGQGNINGEYNTALGAHALNTQSFIGNSDYNTAIGYQSLYSNTGGDNNSALGSFSLYSNTDGESNSAFGYNSLYYNTTGNFNTAHGYNALLSNTSGGSNTAQGYQSLDANTTGIDNTAQGRGSLSSSITGSYNTAQGSLALFYNNSATSTTAVGYRAGAGTSAYNAGELTLVGTEALYNITTGAEDNTALGYRAGYANTSGANNIFLGYQSGDNLTTGSNNIVLGYDIDAPAVDSANTLNIGNLIFGTSIDGTGTTLSSGNIGIGTSSPYAKLSVNGFINTDGTTGGYKIDNNTVLQASSTNFSTLVGQSAGAGLLSDGSANTALGYEALKIATSSNWNTAVGYYSLSSNTTGAGNTAVGSESLYLNTTGSSNTALGFDALYSNTTGTRNTGLGESALYTNDSGTRNVAVGNDSMLFNISGNYNTAIGDQSLSVNEDGVSNVAVGYRALYSNANGDYNVAIGQDALYWTENLNNTAIGYRAGYNNSSGNNNVLLGYQAGDNITTGSNNIILGYDIDAPAVDSANTLNIGNLIFGTSIDGTGTTLSSGNVGIGTSSPQARLTVEGDSGSSNYLFTLASSTDLTASTTDDFWFSVDSTGETDAKGKVLDPIVVGEYQNAVSFNNPTDVKVVGDYAYVAAYAYDALVVLDISDPTDPVVLSTQRGTVPGTTLNGIISVSIQGDYAYVVSRDNDSMAVLDISDPSDTKFIADVQPGGLNGNLDGASKIHVSGNYAYIANQVRDSLAVIDISDPTNPTYLAETQGPTPGTSLNYAEGLYVLGDYAYVAAGNRSSLAVIDISDPANPTFISEYQDGTIMSGANSVFVEGTHAYVTTEWNNSLVIIDISDPNNPALLAEEFGPTPATSLQEASNVVVANNYAYVTSPVRGSLAIIDVSSSTNPVWITEERGSNPGTTLWYAFGVFVQGNYAYVTSETNDSIASIDVGGLTVSNMEAGSAKISSLQVMNGAEFDQGINIRNGLNVGHNALISGALTVTGSASTTLFGSSHTGMVVSTGNVGIGTSSPYAKLSVDGNAVFTGLTNDGTGYYACVITSTGELATSTTACGASSQRYKENIESLTYGLDIVNQLNPVFFDWKKDFLPNGTKQIGFIAEEVELLVPEIVGYNNDGEVMNLDYPKMTAILAKAVQELYERVENGVSAVSEFVGDLISDRIIARNELCVGNTCINETELQAVLAQIGKTSDNVVDESTTEENTLLEPTILIYGNNPAQISLNATYGD